MRYVNYGAAQSSSRSTNNSATLWPIVAITLVGVAALVALPMAHLGLWSASEVLLTQPLARLSDNHVNPVYWSLLHLVTENPNLIFIRIGSLLAAVIGLCAYTQFVLKLTRRPQTALWSTLIIATSWGWLRMAHMEPDISFWFMGIPLVLGFCVPELTKPELKPSPFKLIGAGLLGFGIGAWALGVSVWGLLYGLVISVGLAISHPGELMTWIETLLMPRHGLLKMLGKSVLATCLGGLVSILLGLGLSLVMHQIFPNTSPQWLNHFIQWQPHLVQATTESLYHLGIDALPWTFILPIALWAILSLRGQAISGTLAGRLLWWLLCAVLGKLFLPESMSGGILGMLLPVAVVLGALIEAGVERYWAPKAFRLWTDSLIIVSLIGAVCLTGLLFQYLPDEHPASKWQSIQSQKAPTENNNPLSSTDLQSSVRTYGIEVSMPNANAETASFVGIPLWKLPFLWFPVVWLMCGLGLFVLSILQQASLTPWFMVAMSWLSALGIFWFGLPTYYPDAASGVVEQFESSQSRLPATLWVPHDYFLPGLNHIQQQLKYNPKRYTSVVSALITSVTPNMTQDVLLRSNVSVGSRPVWALVDESVYYRTPWYMRSEWTVRRYVELPKGFLNPLFYPASRYGFGPRQLLLIQGLPSSLLDNTSSLKR